MRRAFAAALLACSTVQAGTTGGTDMSDLWFNITRNGEGFNVIHQGDVLFITFFVYEGGAPVWFVASNATFAGQQIDGSVLYTGPVYRTAGNPPAVTMQQVGSLTFRATSVSSATLEYTVNGVAFGKALTRQTWRGNTMVGSYIGATIGSDSCTGYAERPATITITQGAGGGLVSILASYQGSSCTYSGIYQQNGRMGQLGGTVACSSGATGTFGVDEIEISPQGITGRAKALIGGCAWEGRIGGLRRGP